MNGAKIASIDGGAVASHSALPPSLPTTVIPTQHNQVLTPARNISEEKLINLKKFVCVASSVKSSKDMPKVRRSRKSPPEGWELIEPTLEELEQKMREAECQPHEGKRRQESLWPILQIHHQKSRYIYDLFHRRKAISRVEKSGKYFEPFYLANGNLVPIIKQNFTVICVTVNLSAPFISNKKF
ncbi:hypothetical protein PV328_003077 [Microctonus aethiopoides]|uniref:Uncharacterized protein n=1 Tax=Microctonus aethiopoides TaxID=144406 RepID=A0AA39F7L5_9HYME|nr:hypothetical protein PV328_003077 [Microctonus aethiopoides]